MGRQPVAPERKAGNRKRAPAMNAPDAARAVGGELAAPADIKDDPFTMRCWKQLTASLKGVTKLMASDAAALARLCRLYKEESVLVKLMKTAGDSGDAKAYVELSRVVDGKRKVILSIEDRLYLSPAAKTRAAPPKEEDSPETLELKQAFPALFGLPETPGKGARGGARQK